MTGHVCSPSWQILVSDRQRWVPVLLQNGRIVCVKNHDFCVTNNVLGGKLTFFTSNIMFFDVFVFSEPLVITMSKSSTRAFQRWYFRQISTKLSEVQVGLKFRSFFTSSGGGGGDINNNNDTCAWTPNNFQESYNFRIVLQENWARQV